MAIDANERSFGANGDLGAIAVDDLALPTEVGAEFCEIFEGFFNA